MLQQLVSVVGAVLILAAYLALQRGWLDREQRAFNAMNFVGSALLCWIAVEDRRIGFILLEGIWALLSVPGLLRRPPVGGGQPA
jgi:drug/metabolite transporter (DMT)-like permease